jgi:ribosome-interacting GTPase 1
MPTNLPPQYFEVEKRYKAATEPQEKAQLLEELLGTIPKHKGTDHLRADLRRKLSKLKAAAQQSARKGGRRDPAYVIEREGAGQAAVVGMSNVGKSALVKTLTNASPEVSPAPFTTWTPLPGMMPYENVQIQLLDTPSLDREYVEAGLMDLIRRTDVLLLMVDLQTDPLRQLEASAVILEQYRILPQHHGDRAEDSRRWAVLPALVLANKCDDRAAEENFEIFRRLLEEPWQLLPISALHGHNLERLKQEIFDRLGIIRVYSQAPGREPDRNSPFVMKQGGTVQDFALKIHHDFYNRLRAARVWGHGVYDGQLVSRDHVLHDGDVVELRA